MKIGIKSLADLPQPIYPNVHVDLTGGDGNAMFIVGRAMSAARQAGVPKAELDKFANEALDGDYGHVIRTVMKWFDWQ